MADLSFYISPLSEEIREEGRAQGRAEGRAQGRAEGVLIALGTLGFDVTDAVRERVITCGDPELRRQWLVRAVQGATAEEIFAEEPPAGR